MAYVPLWCKSNFSFLAAASHPEELVRQAAALRMPAIALCDQNGLYGVVRAHIEAKKHDIQLIIGAEISEKTGSRIILLVQNRSGYRHLCRLISTGRMRNPKGQFSVTAAEIAAHAEGLIAVWVGGFSAAAEQSVLLLQRAFGPRLYAAIARHRCDNELQSERLIRRQARQYNIATVAATEVLYHSRERKPLYDVLRCIDMGIRIHEAGTRLPPNAEHTLCSTAEIEARFCNFSDDVQRSIQIADQCNFSLDELRYRYPSERVPSGYSTGGWLRACTLDGARVRYDGALPAEVARQLEKELALIEELDYCGYFLTMYEIVNFCRRNAILCQGRGSAANSAVCYCLGITAIDPVRMGLLFERFISRERAEPPDIDLDIEHNRREEVIQHVYQSYGRERAAMVANVVRYRPRSALREVGKVLGLPMSDVDTIARLLSYHSSDLAGALLQAGMDPQAPLHSRLIELTQQIIDTPRHLSIHPGGFLLGSEPVIDLVPVENAKMRQRTVIQWDKHDVEALGLFKVDLLGLGALTHLDYCFSLLRQHYGSDLSMERIPASDNAVFEMLARGDTIGVFQIESRAQMAMLPRLRPRCFYDLVIEISIVRPGPISGGMVHPYLRRRNGEEEVTYPQPDLVAVLKKTLGVPLFQEQVMRLAMIAADYTPGEADQLRRDMAAWRRSGAIEKHGETIIERMCAKGIERRFAQAVFEQIRGFGEYGFPESHAASFALIAWSSAWMRCHYPAVFSCALLNAWPMGFYSPATIVEDARRRGVTVLPVDVMQSQWECTLAGPECAIRMGLRYVKGMSQRAWQRIRVAREGRVATLEQFLRLSALDEKSLSSLAQSGALETFGVSRRVALWQIIGKRTAESVQEQLAEPEAAEQPQFRPLEEAELIRWNYNTSRHSTDGHPMAAYRQALQQQALPSAADLQRCAAGSAVSFTGLVICRQRPSTAGGTLFLTLEDETGFVNVIVWKHDFQQNRALLLTQSMLGVSGTLQSEQGVTHLILRSCWVPPMPGRAPYVASRDFH